MTFSFFNDDDHNHNQQIPHKCGSVLDIVKISETKSQLVCIVCRKEIGVWVTEKEKKVYPKNARYFTQANMKRFA